MQPTVIVFLCILVGAAVVLAAWAGYRFFDRDMEPVPQSTNDDQKNYMAEVRQRNMKNLADYTFQLGIYR